MFQLLSNVSYASEPLIVSVSLNKTIYNKNEEIIISGIVLDALNQSVSNAIISIQVNDPTNNMIHVSMLNSGSDGKFVDQFVIANGVSGEPYTVYVIASKSGYSDSAPTLANYSVIPEFPKGYTQFLIFAALLMMLIVLKKRGKG